MKAIVKQDSAYASVGVVSVNQPPPPAADEVLIKIHCAALCGSDLHAYEYIPSYHSFLKIPVILGHEGSGVVEAVGPDVTVFAPGDRVMSEAHLYCGVCSSCCAGDFIWCTNKLLLGLTTDGVMCEYILVKEKYLHKVPETLSFAEAAVAQAMSVSVHGVLGRIAIKPGDLVLVSGVGIIGLTAAQLARRCGATVVISGTHVDENIRMPVARTMGFTVLNCQKEDAATTFVRSHGRKADFVLECSGAEAALITAIDAVTKGGSILLLGVPERDVTLPVARLVRTEVSLIASYGSSWQDYEKTISLLADGTLNVNPLISIYPVEHAEKAFLDGLSKAVVKPVLQFIPALP